MSYLSKDYPELWKKFNEDQLLRDLIISFSCNNEGVVTHWMPLPNPPTEK